MDKRRFNRLVRLLATGPPRRTLAACLAAALVGPDPDQSANRKKVGTPCDRGKNDRDGAAGDPANCGACAIPCSAGKSCCAGVCVDLQLNLRNCGACGAVCDRGELCRRGACDRRQGVSVTAAEPIAGTMSIRDTRGVRWTSG